MKLAGEPRQGHIFQKRQDCRMQYRKRIRNGQKASHVAYTNDLHEALLRKYGPTFWKCWRSKFESVNKCNEVNGCVDGDKIADTFREHFSKSYTSNDASRAASLTRCSAIAERPRCRVRYSFRQK